MYDVVEGVNTDEVSVETTGTLSLVQDKSSIISETSVSVHLSTYYSAND